MSPVSSRSALEAMPRHDVAPATRLTVPGAGWSRSGHGMVTGAPPLITIRLKPVDEGTLAELFDHGFEALGADAADNTAAARVDGR